MNAAEAVMALLRGLPGFGVAFWLCVTAWIASEWRIFHQHQAPDGQRPLDRGTLAPLVATLISACVLAGLSRLLGVAPLPVDWQPAALMAGCTLMLAGVAFRQWAVRVLSRHFTVQVHIADDHRLVSHGPYRWLRHPSYTGLLLTVAGAGIAMRDWASIGLLLVVPVLALWPRIRVEEHALATHFGAEYRDYAQRSWGLLPWLW